MSSEDRSSGVTRNRSNEPVRSSSSRYEPATDVPNRPIITMMPGTNHCHGDSPVAPVAIACPAAASFTERFGSIYSLMQAPPPVNRVIGFARIAFTRVAVCPPPNLPFTATITRGVSLVAAANASADVGGRLPLPVTATTVSVRELLDKNHIAPGRLNYAPVLVAALAR